jgi:tight adherence protein B
MGRLARVLLACAGLGLVLVPAAAAQDRAGGPGVLVAHEVDATANPVLVSVLTDDPATEGPVSVVENGRTVTGAQLDRARALGRAPEIVFVVDTSARLASGNAFEELKSELTAALASLPEGTWVSVVAAGDLASVREGLTTDRELAIRAVDNLRLGTSAALWDAMVRGAGELTAGPDRFRTVVVVSSSADSSNSTNQATARAALVRAGAQVVAVRHRGGEPALTALAAATGGIVYGTASDDDLRATLAQALAVAGDRLVVSYPSGVEPGALANVKLTVGGATTELSFTGGSRFDRVTTLAPIAPETSSALPVVGDLFQSRAGLLVALVLAVAGVGLAVFAIGSMVLRTDDSLDGMLARYSLAETADGDEDAGGLGSSAIMRRAVAITEHIAKDRGILAKTEAALEKANIPLRPAEALFLYAVVVVLSTALVVVSTRLLLPTVVVTLLAVVLPIMYVRFKVSSRQKKFESQLPDALQLLAGTLRAGYSLPQGMEAVSHEIEDPMGFELRRVMTEARLGRELEDALEAAAQRLESEDFSWAVMAIGIQREVGGNLNELLMTVADTMVARERLRGEIKTLTAEGKLSAIILGGLPPAIGAIMWTLNPEYINTLFTETLGQFFIAAGLVSATVGMLWMKKVITIDV